MIVPEDLLDTSVAARWVLDRGSPMVEQAALADFIAEGHLASHIRRTRALYMERRSVMIITTREETADVLEVWDSEAGMQFVIRQSSSCSARVLGKPQGETLSI